MIGLATLAAGLAATLQPAEPTRDCDDPRSQAEMNLCASRDFERSDDELNALWPQFIDALRRTGRMRGPAADGRISGEARLREAQRAWITFRDAHCMVVGHEAGGGRLEPVVYNTCRASVTRERIEQLRSDIPLP